MWPHQVPLARRVRALSSVYGKIDQILLAYIGQEENILNSQVDRRYAKLFEAFGDRVSFVVLGNFAQKEGDRFKSHLADIGFDPRLIQIHTPMTRQGHQHLEFVQDPFVIMETHDKEPVILEPYQAYLLENGYLAEQFADVTGYGVLPTRYHLEGGNILVGDNYALIGRNLLERNRLDFYPELPLEEAEKRITEEFQRLLGMRYIFWIGNALPEDFPLEDLAGPEKQQPFYHIDLFLTLAGKDTYGDEIILLAEIDDNAIDKDVAQVKALQQMATALNAVKGQIEKISKAMAGPRFNVVEIPMSGKFPVPGDAKTFVPYSYNNAQVECYHGISRIYLPDFPDSEAHKADLQKTLHGLGFKRPVFIEHAFDVYATKKSGLHCITKVLKRSTFN